MPFPIAFEQHPEYQPGVGDFVFDDGSRRFGHDPELAGALAQNDAPRQGVTTLNDQQPPGPAPTATDAAPPPMAPAKPGEIGPPLPPGPPPPPQLSPADAYRAAVLQEAHAPVHGAGRSAAYVPKTKAETVETTAPPIDPEWLKQYSEAKIEEVKAQHAAAQTVSMRAQAEGAQLATQLPVLQQQAAEQQAKHAAIEQSVNNDRTMLKTAMADAASKKIDPNHFFESKSTLSQIGIVLGQAFGAYAATLGKGRNFAQEQIDQMINNDIASQRAEIEQGHANVNNALARYNLTFKDLDQAESALRATQQSIAANMVNQWGALNKSQDAQNGLAMWDAQNKQAILKEMRAFDTQAYGKHTAQLSMQYREAQRAGDREPTPDEIRKRLAVRKEESEMGLTPDLSPEGARKNRALEIDQQKANAAGAAGGPKQPRQAMMNSVNANNALHLIDRQLDRMGVQKDKNGVYQDPGLMSSASSAIKNRVEGTFDTSQALAREAIADEFGKAIAGGVMDKDSAERVHALIGNGSPRALIQAREIMETTLRHNQNVTKLSQPGAPSTSDTSDATEYDGSDEDAR